MNDLEIFPLRDCPELAATCAAWSFAEWGCMKPERSLEYTVERYRSRVDQENEEIPLTWVGKIKDKTVGMISLAEEDHPDCKDLSPWVASFYIHPRFRGNGFAHVFMKHVELKIKELGYKMAYLYTPDADGLYKKHGWETIDHKRDPMELQDHVILMRKAF